MGKRNFFIFNISNLKAHYSKCLEFILSLEHNDQEKAKSLYPWFTDPKNNASVYLYSCEQVFPVRELERQLSKSEFALVSPLAFQKEQQDKRYYIRINTLEPFDFSGLQFLALLIRRLSDFIQANPSNQEHRLKIFFNNQANNNFYDAVSLYLRLLAKEYNGTLYALNDQGAVSAVDFKTYVERSAFFPLIPIDSDSYNKLIQPIDPAVIRALFTMQEGRRFKNSRDKDPTEALPDFIAEVSYYKLKETFGGDLIILDDICSGLLSVSSAVTLLQLSVFSFLSERYRNEISLVGRFSADNFNRVYSLAADICAGVRQVLENVIQHSESHCGFYQFAIKEDENKEKYLQIKISDLNGKDTLAEHFIKELEKEYTNGEEEKKQQETGEIADACATLLAVRNKICISDFFDVESEITPQWNCYRNAVKIKHFGLQIFKQALSECEAYFQITSSTSFQLDEKNVYRYTEKQNVPHDGDSIIPGTDIVAVIPLQNTLKENRFDSGAQLDYFDESYSCFAKYLEYKTADKTDALCDEFALFRKNASFDVASAERKEWFTKAWAGSLASLLTPEEPNCAVYFDIRRLLDSSSYGNYEVFARGIIRGILLNLTRLHPLIAFINVPSQLIEETKNQLKVRGGFRDAAINPDIQLFMHSQSDDRSLTLFGVTVQDAINNAYTYSLEHGLGVFDPENYEVIEKSGLGEKKYQVFPFDAMLETTVRERPDEPEERLSLFDKKIKTIAQRDLCRSAGYKIGSHMRLGNKVHINGFFELSFLFYRTYIANRSAFEILLSLRAKADDSEKARQDAFELLQRKRIIFYGYASYSKAILTSLTEILRAYRIAKLGETEGKEAARKVNLIAYQHNLQTETTLEETQLFYGFEHKEKIPVIDPDTTVIQIVPISSTLTTFSKMWADFRKQLYKEKQKDANSKNKWLARYYPTHNFSVFWVRADKPEKGGVYYQYIKKENLGTRYIVATDLVGVNNTRFLISAPLKWDTPLGCEKCFPQFEDLTIEEPLVETDVTSTVPTQQIRAFREVGKRPQNDAEYERNRVNNARLLKLLECDCIRYGHLKRRNNHYQFYIDTQRFFYSCQDAIAEWLIKLRESTEESTLISPKLNIIFVPEHNTNVGFAQYVNTYYFHGSAEIVSINVDKEYRSNFECEHEGLRITIATLLGKWQSQWGGTPEACPIKFFYTDDTIITGGTFHRANDLLLSLIPKDYLKYFPVCVIEKAFIFIDRFSECSKNTYIKLADKNYHYFLHIDNSSIRTNGDSCVCCKLEKEALKLLSKSSTKGLSEYWQEKVQIYSVVPFDKTSEEMTWEKKKKEHAILLIISHVFYNYIFRYNAHNEYTDIYDSIRKLFRAFFLIKKELIPERDKPLQSLFDIVHEDQTNHEEYWLDSEIINQIKKQTEIEERFQLLVKIISRPYFTFDTQCRKAVLNLLLQFAHIFLGISFASDNGANKPVLEEVIKACTKDEQKLNLLRSSIIEPLSDIRSNFILRKNVIIAVSKYVDGLTIYAEKEYETFWRHYAAYIQVSVDCGNDETKSLWFEHLLLTGKEYSVKTAGKPATIRNLFDALEGNALTEPANIKAFRNFCDEILLLNASVLFKGLEKWNAESQNTGDYFLNNWIIFRTLDAQTIKMDKNAAAHQPVDILISPQGNDTRQRTRLLHVFQNILQQILIKMNTEIKLEKDVFTAVDTLRNHKSKHLPQRYQSLLEKIADMLQNKYNLRRIAVVLFTRDNEVVNTEEYDEHENDRVDFLKYDIAAEYIKQFPNPSMMKYGMKFAIIKAYLDFDLLEYGYTIKNEGDCKYKIILFFDNIKKAGISEQNNYYNGRTMKPVAPVFFCFDLEFQENMQEVNRDKANLLILRDVLMYRNRIMRLLESDFSSEIFGQFAHKRDEKEMVAHEKAMSHASTTDDEIEYKILIDETRYTDREEKLKWIIFKSYVNRQIGRLYCRNFEASQQHDENHQKSTPLSVSGEERFNISPESAFMYQPLETLVALTEDSRFQMFQKLVDIQGLDESLTGKKLVEKNGMRYNKEYLLCLLFDVLFTSIKYSTGYKFNDLLELYYEEPMNAKITSIDETLEEKGRKRITAFKERFKHVGPIAFEQDGRFLVIRNLVDKGNDSANISNYTQKNQRIQKRLDDPLDFPDGHMSLGVMKKYTEWLLDPKIREKSPCSFMYTENAGTIMPQTVKPDGREGDRRPLYFETKLPIFSLDGEDAK